jgi:hypothetical protein
MPRPFLEIARDRGHAGVQRAALVRRQAGVDRRSEQRVGETDDAVLTDRDGSSLQRIVEQGGGFLADRL